MGPKTGFDHLRLWNLNIITTTLSLYLALHINVLSNLLDSEMLEGRKRAHLYT
jgi:hypothetical protein